ncbi:hypothetical protein FOL47_009886 [Perkinsus chesapeaki]|uniref:Uncharacterized protein n=1 Tax=Perkinsus chesapeaki TaxID=330153 RepID=A0A7J6MQT1_PERCH|nr:hypothetical protein FOL47_009886 [Perkinsus chesapeaki]
MDGISASRDSSSSRLHYLQQVIHATDTTARFGSAFRLNEVISPPSSWGIPRGTPMPIFNPSIVSTTVPHFGEVFITTARISNGPGCPHFQNAEFNSLKSGVLRNELIIALIDSECNVMDTTLVDFPDRFVASYDGSTDVHRVEGPMDVRIFNGKGNDSWWISFFAEYTEGKESGHRAVHFAPLHLSLTACNGESHSWRPNATSTCMILHAGEHSDDCLEHCTSLGGDDCEISKDYCICRRCQNITNSGLTTRYTRTQSKARSLCIQRAYIHNDEVVSVGDTGRTEKNWQLIEVSTDLEELWVHYSVQPSIKMRISLDWPEGVTRNGHPRPVRVASVALDSATATWWDPNVIHRISNVRGGYCCVAVDLEWLPFDMKQFMALNHPKHTKLLLGVGHMQRIRQLGDQMKGNRTRLEGIRNTRAYKQFFFLLAADYPFTMLGASPEFCFESGGRYSPSAQGPTCEAIQFISGLTLASSLVDGDKVDLVISYGINDCEAIITRLDMYSVLGKLRPTANDLVDWVNDEV